MRYAESVLDLIGGTPLVRLNSVTEGIGATVLAKVEYLNPGGSIKDRIALEMVERAERSGELRPGGTIVEPTSGNTGVGLALVGQLKGYDTVFVTPDKVGEEKRAVLRAYGADVVVTPTAVAPDSPESYYGVSDRLVREIDGAYKPDQFSNPAAPDSHYASTGPEIWNDTDGLVTHVVIGAGTGGTITGTGRYLKDVSADRASGPVTVVAADPDGSVYSGGTGRPYFTEGVGEDMWPGNYDPAVPDRLEAVTDAESFEMTRRLAREEGLLVGGSSGMAVVAALRVARELPHDAVVVVILPDSGRGYLAKIFDDAWMERQGFSTHTGGSGSDVGSVAAALARVGDAAGRALPATLSVAEAIGALGAGGYHGAVAVIAGDALPVRIGEVRGSTSLSVLAARLAAGEISGTDVLAEVAGEPLVQIGAGQATSEAIALAGHSGATALAVAADGDIVGVLELGEIGA